MDKGIKHGLLAVCLFGAGTTACAQEITEESGGRYELWAGAMVWPSLADLEPSLPGEFDSAGFAIGGALHVPVRRFESSDLMLGIDAMVAATDSNARGFLEVLTLRQIYLGLSARWRLGQARAFSFDTGAGLHIADVAQVDTSYFYGPLEFRSWEQTAGGAFVGATWDIGASRPLKSSGLFVAFKAHFVDFGVVRDEEVLFGPALGSNAGRLDGPFYLIQVGYSGF